MNDVRNVWRFKLYLAECWARIGANQHAQKVLKKFQTSDFASDNELQALCQSVQNLNKT